MSRPTIPSKRPADAQEAAWVADEDRFVLQQAKKKAVIRVKGGRAQPIDWLAVTLSVVDPSRNPLDDEEDFAELDLVDPEGVLEGLDMAQLAELEKGIDTYVTLEKSRSNQEYWTTMKTIVKDRQNRSASTKPTARGVNSVASDLDKLLAPKSYDELERLEKQIRTKLQSNEPMDTDYWEHLLKGLLIWKAKAKLRNVSQSIIAVKFDLLRMQQVEAAREVQTRLESVLQNWQAEDASDVDGQNRREVIPTNSVDSAALDSAALDSAALDPEPSLRLRPEDKSLESVSEKEFASKITQDRQKILKLGYVPVLQRASNGLPALRSGEPSAKRQRTTGPDGDETVQSTVSLYDREVARGVSDNEEVFTNEEEVQTKNTAQWSGKHRPRKPRYFNRVQTGYEWNKYNQTHYDAENPPPKVVQGYKFNIFYPDLIDKNKAPTFKIERENGRKRGQLLAPAGEEDTCLIRFIAGPPYQDVAFRIVDKEWDYSAKRERGFRSSFDKGILQLHFQFKKIFYRK